MKTNSFTSPRNLAICLLGLLLSTAACKKDTDGVTPVNNDDTPVFVDKNLRISAVTSDPLIDLDGDGKVDKDLLAFLRPCDTDNIVRFEKGGRLSGNDGALKCSDGNTDTNETTPGKWTYNANTHILRLITGPNENVAEWEILEASATGLKAKVSTQDSNDPLKLIMTWKVQ
ncbi:hypothetical protein [Spirosoma areae]